MDRVGIWTKAAVALAMLPGLGCASDSASEPDVPGEPTVQSRVRPPPIAGGTLLVTDDDQAVASDPDRDTVFIVDLDTRSLTHTLALEAGDRPGRIAEGAPGRVHVLLTGAGAMASIDSESGEVLARTPVCSEPRGIGHDPDGGLLYVACASGQLVTLDEATAEVLERQVRQPDLRDVVVVDGEPIVSTFRQASLEYSTGAQRTPETSLEHRPRIAWRTRLDPSGNVLMLHQMQGQQDVPLEPQPPEGTTSPPHPYGGGGGCKPGISSVALTRFTGEGVTTGLVPLAPLTVDAAIAPGGGIVAYAMPGAPKGSATVAFAEPGSRCELVSGPSDHQVTAVDWSRSGVLVMQSREPAALLIQTNVPTADVETIALDGESRYDTAHELFHRATESGVSCASCHPQGGDDGHVWRFEGIGPRRTLPLDVGIAEGPLHWDGEFDGLSSLLAEVMVERMGGDQVPTSHAASLSSWLDDNAGPAIAVEEEDPDLVAAGQAAFASLGCTSCHALDGAPTVAMSDIEGETLKTPSLRRVSLRAPYMHDGRGLTLEDAVADMIAATTTQDGSDDVSAIAAFVRTL